MVFIQNIGARKCLLPALCTQTLVTIVFSGSLPCHGEKLRFENRIRMLILMLTVIVLDDYFYLSATVYFQHYLMKTIESVPVDCSLFDRNRLN